MTKYSKLIVAVVGLAAVILGPDFLGVSPEGTILGIAQDVFVQGLIAILTAFGVFQVTNTA